MTKPDGFEELVVRYQSVVCAVAYAVLRDRARSEEVAQDAFLIAWQKLPAMTPPPAMPGWLCGIARNLAANAARRREETAMETEPTTSQTPLDAVLDHEADELARRALATLKDHDREAVVLYYRGNASIVDVATTLGITETAARQRVHRGRERLRSALGAVETTLRATRPGPAVTAACVAALATRGTVASAAAATTTRGTAPAALGVAAVIGLVGAVAVAQSTATPSSEPELRAAIVVPEPTGSSRAQPATGKPLLRTIDDATKTQLATRIRSARDTRTAALPIASPAKTKVYDFSGGALDDTRPLPPLADPTKLTKATMRHAIRDTQPLLLECYAAAYDRLARKD